MCSVRPAISLWPSHDIDADTLELPARERRRDTEPPTGSTRLVGDDLLRAGHREREVVTGAGTEGIDQRVANLGAVLGRLAKRDIKGRAWHEPGHRNVPPGRTRP